MAAKASLISMRSTSPELPAGALQRLLHGRHRAEAEHAGLDRRDAIGDEPRHRLEAALLRPSARRPRTIAAAPLFRPGALPAVIVPSSRKAGLSRPAPRSSCRAAVVLVRVERRRCPCGRVSRWRRSRRVNLPAAWAAPKRCCERSAHRSCASRVMLEVSHQVLGVPARSLARERVVRARRAACCRGSGRRPCGSPSGRRHQVRRQVHVLHAAGDGGVHRRRARISCAAETIACAPEPQTRFTVIAGTDTGRPPPTAAWRPDSSCHRPDDVAHDGGADLVGPQAGALDRAADHTGAEIGGGDFLEAATEVPIAFGPDWRKRQIVATSWEAPCLGRLASDVCMLM